MIPISNPPFLFITFDSLDHPTAPLHLRPVPTSPWLTRSLALGLALADAG